MEGANPSLSRREPERASSPCRLLPLALLRLLFELWLRLRMLSSSTAECAEDKPCVNNVLRVIPPPKKKKQKKHSKLLLLEVVKGGVPASGLLELSWLSVSCFGFFELRCVSPSLSSSSSNKAGSRLGRLGACLPGGWTSVSVTGYLAVTEPVVAPQFRTWFGFGGSTVGLWLFLRQSLWWRLIQVGAGVFTAGAGHGVELEAGNVSCTLFLGWRHVRLASYVYILSRLTTFVTLMTLIVRDGMKWTIG